MGMVRSSRQVAGGCLLKGESSRQQCSAHGQPGALHQRPGGRESDAPLLLAGQAITAEGLVVRTSVDPLEIRRAMLNGLWICWGSMTCSFSRLCKV